MPSNGCDSRLSMLKSANKLTSTVSSPDKCDGICCWCVQSPLATIDEMISVVGSKCCCVKSSSSWSSTSALPSLLCVPPINAGEFDRLIKLWLLSVGLAISWECVCWYGCSCMVCASDEARALSSLNARRWWCWAAVIWSIICGRGTVLFDASNVENASWWLGDVAAAAAADDTIVGSMGSDVLRTGDVGRCKCIRFAAAVVVVVTVGNVISIELWWLWRLLCWCCCCDCDCEWWWFTLVSSKSKCTNNSSVFIETEERTNPIHTVNINTTASFGFAALMHTHTKLSMFSLGTLLCWILSIPPFRFCLYFGIRIVCWI